jgi:predicted PurR-regulated permease PerM
LEQFKKRAYWLLGIVLVLVVVYLAREALLVVFTAFIFASALLPLVETLDKKLPRWLAVLVPYTLLLIVAIGIVLPLATIVWQQLQRLLADMPRYLDDFKAWITQWSFISRRYPFLTHLSPESAAQQLSLQNALVFSGFTGITLAISQIGLDLLTAFIISFFLLLDREKIQQYFLRFRPLKDHARLNELVDHLIRSTGAFVSGQLLFMVSFGALITLGLYQIGLPFPLLIGSLTGLLTIIPIIGPNIAMIIAIFIALSTAGGWVAAVWVFILYLAVQVLANNIIGPWIMGKAVGLHPLAIILAIMFGGMLLGLPGIVLAIPVAACLNIILEEWFMDPEHRLEKMIIAQDAATSSLES